MPPPALTPLPPSRSTWHWALVPVCTLRPPGWRCALPPRCKPSGPSVRGPCTSTPVSSCPGGVHSRLQLYAHLLVKGIPPTLTHCSCQCEVRTHQTRSPAAKVLRTLRAQSVFGSPPASPPNSAQRTPGRRPSDAKVSTPAGADPFPRRTQRQVSPHAGSRSVVLCPPSLHMSHHAGLAALAPRSPCAPHMVGLSIG